MATIFRAPTATRVPAKPPAHARADAPNTTATLLAGKDQFFAAPGMAPWHDWPNPIRPAYPAELRTYAHGLRLTLLNQDRFFGAAGEVPAHVQPNPIRPHYPLELRTFRHAAAVHLIGKDQFFAAAGEAPRYDWPNPTVTVYPIELRSYEVSTPLALLMLIGVTGQARKTDWPNPTATRFPSDLRNFTGSTSTALSTVQPIPCRPVDGPQPSDQHRFGNQLRTLPGSSPLVLIGAPTSDRAPNFVWPNPLPTPFPVALRTFTRSTPIDLLSTQTPIRPSELRQPTPCDYPVALRTFVSPTRLNLIGQDQFFGAPGEALALDWPNPIVPARREAYALAGNNSALNFAPVGTDFVARMVLQSANQIIMRRRSANQPGTRLAAATQPGMRFMEATPE